MRILLDSSLDETLSNALKRSGHQVLHPKKASLASNIATADADRRILIAPSGTLRELISSLRNPHPGVILLEKDAMTAASYRFALSPLLTELAERHVSNHFICVSKKASRWIVHLNFSQEHEIERIVIPKSCREDFLGFYPTPNDDLLRSGVLLSAFSQVEPPYEVHREKPFFHLVILVLEGTLEFKSHKVQQKLGPGKLLMARSGTQYQYRATSDCRFLWFHLEADGIWDDFLTTDIKVNNVQSDELVTAAEGLLAESRKRVVDSPLICRALADLIVAYLQRELRGGRPPSQIGLRRQIDRLVETLRNELTKKWTVTDMGKIAGCSPTHLHRLCLRMVGQHPMEMLRNLRMEKAKALLLSTNYKLEHIASMVGYGDAFSFSKAFKRFAGLSPEALRRGEDHSNT